MMLILCTLLLTHFLCHVHPLECGFKGEYDDINMQCCNKCEPGQRMSKRCSKNSQTECKPCTSDFYMDEYSNEIDCKRCTQCTKEHMLYKVNCSKSSDAVCDCESGYKCNGRPCTNCVKIPPPPPPPPPPTTTTTTTTTPRIIVNTINAEQPTALIRDTVWITLTLSLCCVCILLTCFILISRHISTCGWIMLASPASFWGFKKHSSESSQCTEDEEVPMPVQEVCGHKEWQGQV